MSNLPAASSLPSILNLTHQFPASSATQPTAHLQPFSFESSATGGDTGEPIEPLPHNPLASLVGANLQEWLEDDEDEEEDGEGDEDDENDDDDAEDRDNEDDEDEPDEEKEEEKEQHTQRNLNLAIPSTPAAASSSSSSTLVALPAKKPRKPRRAKRASQLLAERVDDSVELGEILGTGYGGAKRGGTSRGKMMVMRRGTRAGKISKLTPDLEKRMGEANSAYINQEFARAVDILLHIIQSAPHAEGPYHTLGLIYEERHEITKAIEAYLLAAHMSRRDLGLWKRVAKMAQENGQLEHAVYCWNKILQTETDNEEMRWERALAYFDLKNFRRALDGYQYLLKRRPHHTEYLRQAASCFSHLKRPQSGVTLILGYLEWFKETVEKNEQEKNGEASGRHQNKRQKTSATTSQATRTESAEDDSVEEEDYSHLTLSDLDIDLVNIMCELLLSLHKYQDIVDYQRDLQPFLRASAKKTVMMSMAGTVGLDLTDDQIELPFDLLSKLGIACLYLKEYARAEEIFQPLLEQPSSNPSQPKKYDVESWGDLYVEVAEAYVMNKKYPQAENLLGQVLQSNSMTSTWAHMKSKIFFLQARCAYAQAHIAIQKAWSNPSISADSPHSELLLRALNMYERVHIEEDGKNIPARVAMSEIYQLLNEPTKAMEILRGIETEAASEAIGHGEMWPSSTQGDDDAKMGVDAPAKGRAPVSASASMKFLDEMRVFNQTCELHLQAGEIDNFLAISIPVFVNLIHASMLVIENSDAVPMPHRMTQPVPPFDPASRGLPTFTVLPIDKSHSYQAQRSMLTIEFLRPACAAIKHLYARNRHDESLWLIHYLEPMLLRFQHTQHGHGSEETPLSTSSIVQPVKRDQKSGMITTSMTFTEQVRLIMLGFKYVLAGIFLRYDDTERAYHAIKGPLWQLPYNFPIAHTMNIILNRQSYPGKATKALDRLWLKYPDALPVNMLLGHGCLVHQNYEGALNYYLHVYEHAPKHALVLLLIGITKLQISLKKLNRHRHHDLLLAFSFLYQYVETRKAETSNQPFATQEAYYNLARAFQYVGLLYLAIPYYEKVLHIGTTPIRTPDETKSNDAYASPSSSSSPAAAAMANRQASLHSDAAHNLACAYSQNGAPDLARRLYAQYCKV